MPSLVQLVVVSAATLWRFGNIGDDLFHTEAAVRRAVLVALCAVGRALIPALVVAEFEALLPELQEWLRIVAAEDVSEGCRQLAAACHGIYGKCVLAEMGHTATNEVW